MAAFMSGAPAVGFPFAFLAALLAFTLWLYRQQLVLVARLLAISLHALADMPGIIVAALGLQVVGEWRLVVCNRCLTVCWVPIVRGVGGAPAGH